MTLYITNAAYIHWQDLTVKKTHIRVDEGKTGTITFLDTLPDPIPDRKSDTVLDAAGKFVTKSFGCGHHHIYSTLARGMPAPAKTPDNFVEILKYVWWHLDKNLDQDMIKASALASALYCAKNGVTFVIDHHASPFAVEGALFAIQEAFDRVGISHMLCYEISDRDGDQIRNRGLEETRQYLEAGFQGHVGLHASFTVGDTLLEKAVALAREYRTGIHIHVAEDRADQEHCKATHGKGVIERLKDAGVLDLNGSILGHCIHLDDREKNLIKNAKAWVVQNVESNLNNNVGTTGYTAHGDRIMLGTDGMHSDMLRSAKAAFLNGQVTEGISFPGIYERFRNVHHYLEQINARGDGDNNLVILDYNTPTPLTADNFLGHFVFGMDAVHVDSVISSGKLIVKNKKLVSAGEEEILAFAREMAVKLWEKLV
jgi:cytosine/adenosine deaminase-related metal-dependent hydrolase